MTNEIALTAALRSNLLSLQHTQSLLDQTQLRLATGLKVNSALDNPSSFFAAQSLNNRAGDFSRLLDGIGQAVQTLKAADEGIKSLTSLLEQAQAIAQEARDQATGGAVVNGDQDIDATEAADLGQNLANTDDGDQFTVRLGPAGSPETTITIDDGETLQDVLDELNTIDGLTATTVAGTNAGEVRVRLQSTNGQDITISELGGNTAAASIFGSGAGVGVGTTSATAGAPEDEVELEANYNELLTQIDALVSDAGYRGTNLLDSGNLTVNFNEDGSSSLTISGVDFTSGGDLSIGSANFGSVSTIDDSLDDIEAALSTVRAQARTFGNNLGVIQTRQDFTNNLISTLQEGANKLVLADKNEEGANLLALQTSQQLGITSLSLASQANQSILRLFG